MASKSPLAPAKISRATISFLLSLYPHTIREFYRAKLIAKSTPKAGAKNSSKRSTTKRKTEETIEMEVEAFLELGKLRYEIIPAALKNRAGIGSATDTSKKNEGKGEEEDVKRPRKKIKVSKDDDGSPAPGPFLEKDEIVNLMDWKLKHGSHRPALMGMIRSNPESLVRSTTRMAFSQLRSVLSNTGGENFPAAPLETLTGPLRGVGPATASLFLSSAPCQTSSDDPSSMDINAPPFFSDELFNWLCLDKYAHDFPNSSNSGRDGGGPRPKGKSPAMTEAKIKYNMKEYRELWEAVRKLRERVNQIHNEKGGVGDGRGKLGSKNENISVLDIERVAFVIGHLDVSGYEEAMKEASIMAT
ncbi:conserved hypothetical protein [Histoplasma capsulatum G186AR]|uniref:Uncharacterized protein n=2 Tax=Ajellomyces capsulatus TaxID=5037 RepID=C0NMQ4_AJECG|nr:uncharacterized protein HCBG_04031 [Histoplasma capsulatum G186AR]EEH07152.1 conserved hypothetical protein [Histoplasma capsulatum G186AR]KAG5287858.1 hypothetical protein I7I52_11768 [Histoplasma capsulatum]QSS70326.1 hypothetical protein I7I50_11920 [Histoplasma capsulatum G186AR]